MSRAFADTFYFLALLNQRDPAHPRALAAAQDAQLHCVTTDWVLVELGDALCAVGNRAEFSALYQALQFDARWTIVPADRELLDRAVALDQERPDQDWPLTDCISFLVMQDAVLTEALTGDHHFAQAGFQALLK